MDIKNLSIVRQTFANTVFTHKVQEISAEKQELKNFVVKIVNIVFVLLVLVLLFVQILYPQETWLTYLGVGVTIGEIIFLIIQLTFSFEQNMVAHKNSALKFMSLRDNYRSLIADIMNESISKSMIANRRDLLQHEYQTICDLSPQTGPKDYAEAQRRLNKKGEVTGEEFTWSDIEIDRFLPETLRLATYNKTK